MKTFKCGTGEMGTLYWSKDGKQSEMAPATQEQLDCLDIKRDAQGAIVSAQVKADSVPQMRIPKETA